MVASHLGNSADLSPRALQTLRSVDVILAEDTRTARLLLAAQGIATATRSCFDANEEARAVEAAGLLAEGKNIALLSEAGTPAISDPGYKVVRAAVQAGARVVPVPGPSALLAALIGSGLPTDSFYFAGFAPRKAGARRKLFETLAGLPATLIFYESPHRVGATLADLQATLGPSRAACVARELTKTHEEFVRGTIDELARRYQDDRPLGEVTLLVAGRTDANDAALADNDTAALAARARALLSAGHSSRDAAQILTAETGRPRREIYQFILDLAGGKS